MSLPRFLILSLLLAGCTSSPRAAADPADEPADDDSPPPSDDDDGPDPSSRVARLCADDGASADPAEHPFAPLPDLGEGLVDVSSDLEEVLEHGTLPGACARWEADPGDRRKKLLCGKEMFFYETFGTAGMPGSLVRFLVQNFPAQIGEGFSRMGMIRDPYDEDALPLGFAPTARPTPDSISYTCASCHFGRTADGRYAVGQPNHEYDYGGQVLSLFLFPQLAMPFGLGGEHHPDAVARVQPLVDAYNADFGLQLAFAGVLFDLMGAAANAPTISREIEAAYASWPVGTQDFMMAPTPIDDGVHTVHRIQPIWDLPTAELIEASGADGALLGWSGGTWDVRDFLRGFVDLGFGSTGEFDDARLEPLAAYLESLRAPDNPAPPPRAEREAGCEVFAEAGCLSCHDGVSGAGKRVYAMHEVGTDPAIARWMDPEGDGTMCCDIDDADFEITNGVKSPRLVGLWSFRRFLHNGSLDSLEQLFCLEDRPERAAPLGSQGHTFGCELPERDRRALIAYLLSH